MRSTKELYQHKLCRIIMTQGLRLTPLHTHFRPPVARTKWDAVPTQFPVTWRLP